MKPLYKRLFITAGICFLAGLICAFIAFTMTGFHLENLNELGVYAEETYVSKTDVSKIQKIDLHTNNVRVEVYGTTEKEISVHYYNREKDFYTIEEQNGELSIRKASNRAWYDYVFNFGNWTQQETLQIYIPKTFDGNLLLTTSNQFICLNDLNTVKNLECDTSNGMIWIDGLQKADTIWCMSSNGGINMQNIKQVEQIDTHTSNGYIWLENVEVSGDVTADTSNNHISIWKMPAANYTLTTSNGNIEGSIRAKRSDYTVNGDTSNGKSNVDGGRADQKGEKKLYVETSNGDIDIQFLKD